MAEKLMQHVRQAWWILILLTGTSFCISGYALDRPLPVEEAFKVSATVDNPQQVTVHLQSAEDYYLYRKHLKFTFEPETKMQVDFPAGQVKQDLNLGEYQVYPGNTDIAIHIQPATQKVNLKINYQGCSVRGFCYPPMEKTVELDMGQAASVAQAASPSLKVLLTDQNRVNALFGSQSLPFMLLIFAGLGLLLAFTPCVLPMIPILMSIILGHKQALNPKKAFSLSIVYVLGSALTYAAAGVLVAYMGGSLQTFLQQTWLIVLTSGLFVLLSLSLFGFYDLRLPGAWQNRITSLSRKQQGGTYVGVFIMGMVSTLIVSPCVTAPLVGVLMYIAQSGNMLLGASALFVMGLGMGVPLIVIALSAGKWMPKRGPWMVLVQYLFGVLMLGMATWLLSRVFTISLLINALAIVMLGAGIFLSIMRASRYLGIMIGICGVLLIATINMSSFFTPTEMNQPQSTGSFTIVKNLDDLNQALSQAKGKPVLLDFYADWCESCVSMDKKVFSRPDIKDRLNQFVLLRVDVTNNDSADEKMLKNFDVVAPPTVLFFNVNGEEVNSRRIVGELDAHEFKNRITTFIAASCDQNASC